MTTRRTVMRVVSFRAGEAEVDTLTRMAAEVGIPRCTLIRDALRLYIEDLTDAAETYPVNTPVPRNTR